jgi:hypothetical protein
MGLAVSSIPSIVWASSSGSSGYQEPATAAGRMRPAAAVGEGWAVVVVGGGTMVAATSSDVEMGPGAEEGGGVGAPQAERNTIASRSANNGFEVQVLRLMFFFSFLGHLAKIGLGHSLYLQLHSQLRK